MQVAGGIATLLSTVWLGKVLGPELQGSFSQTKATVEFGAAVCAMGLPQTLYAYVQSKRMNLREAAYWARLSGLLGLPVGGLLAWWSLRADSWSWTFAVSIAVMLCAWHAHARALTLLAPSATKFGLVTFLPQGLLLLLAAWLVMQKGASQAAWTMGMGATWAVGAVMARSALLAIGNARGVETRDVVFVGASELFGHSLWLWISVVLASGSVVMWQGFAATSGDAILGSLTLALLIAQVPSTLLAYGVPLMLRYRLSDESGDSERVSRYTVWLVVPMVGAAAIVWIVGYMWRDHLGMGRGYVDLHWLISMLLLAACADGGLRLMGVDAQAEWKPWRIALAECTRLLLLVVGIGLSRSWLGELSASTLAMIWLVSAWGAWLCFWLAARRGAGSPRDYSPL